MKYLYYDLETSGLDPRNNCILSMAVTYVDTNNGKEESAIWYFSPHPLAKIDDEALKANRLSRADIMLYPNWKESFHDFKLWIDSLINRFDRKDKAHLVGFNNRKFDDQFLRKLFELAEDKFYGSYLWSDSIDVSVLASQIMGGMRKDMPNFKLMTVAEYLGIKVDKDRLHEASYDVELTKECHEILLKQILNYE